MDNQGIADGESLLPCLAPHCASRWTYVFPLELLRVKSVSDEMIACLTASSSALAEVNILNNCDSSKLVIVMINCNKNHMLKKVSAHHSTV